MEEAEGPEAGGTGAESSGAAGVDPFAAAMALGGASRAKADAFLDDQRSLIDIQKHHLNEQFKHLREQLRLGIWEKRLGVLLRIATAFTGLAIAAGITVMIWDASQSNGLVIEPFSVPPDLAARGVTGEVVASKLLDQIATLEGQTSSQRAPRTYANGWTAGDIKLDIPETGVSLSELDRFLRAKLGHDTHVTGEVVRTISGISLTARAGDAGAETVEGGDSDIEGLLGRLGEKVYGLTQPYRYGVYLNSHGRQAEAEKLYAAEVKSGPPDEQAWDYNGLNNATVDRDGTASARVLLAKALRLSPQLGVVLNNLSRLNSIASRPEQVIAWNRRLLAALDSRNQALIRPDFVPLLKLAAEAIINLQLGAFDDAARQSAGAIAGGLKGREGLSTDLARGLAGKHEIDAARAANADTSINGGVQPGESGLYQASAAMVIAMTAEDWSAILGQVPAVQALLSRNPGMRAEWPTSVSPFLSTAQARLGRTREAEKEIAPTPADCYDCLIARAQVAELQGQHARADWWFDRAVKYAPSIPFAESEWGKALLARDTFDAAIVQFKLANQKGPHFADPLEGWGEALMAQNRSDLALAKFTEAEKYAPNWGRLHLKWGEALIYAVKKDEAQKQFATAATLDLTAAEKAELTKVRGHV